MTINKKELTKAKFFGYISFIASVLTILDMLKKYLFTGKETSFSLSGTSALELFIILFLMMLSVFFLSKERKNTNFLILAGYLYASITFFIYVITAYQYIIGNHNIQNFSLEVLLVFLTSFISAILIFKKLKNNDFFNKYAYLFVLGLFIVLAMLSYKMIIQNSSQMKIFQVIIYLMGGTGIFSLLFFFGKNITNATNEFTMSDKIKCDHIDEDARW